MASWLMAGAGLVALFCGPLGTRYLVHWWHQPDPGRRAAGAVVPPPRQPEPDWLDSWLPAPLGHALGSIRTYDPVPWEDLQSDARIEDDRDGDQTAAWFHGLGEDPCEHEYTPNVAGTHEWCQKCDSVRVIEDPGPGVHSSSEVPPGPDHCPRCGVAHREPHCADGREWGPWPPEPTRLATAADVDAARPWIDVQREWLDGQYGEFYAWLRGVLAA